MKRNYKEISCDNYTNSQEVCGKVSELLNRIKTIFEDDMNVESFREELDRNIPSIIMFGPQTSGKTSLLIDLCNCEFLKSTISHKLGTKYPTVIHNRTSCENHVKIHNIETKKIYQCTEIKEAQNFIETKIEDYTHYKNIYVEIFIKSKINLTLIDLPGCVTTDYTNTENIIQFNDNYYYDLINRYVKNKKNAFIFHVHQCLVDTSTLISNKYLYGIENVYHIKTFCDKLDKTKLDEILQVDKNKRVKTILTSTDKSSFNKFIKEQKYDNAVIKGVDELRDFLLQLTNYAMLTNKEIIIKNLKGLNEFFKKQIEYVGREPPNPNLMIGIARNFTKTNFDKVIESSNIQLMNAISSININTIKNVQNKILDIDKINEETLGLSRNCLKGSENIQNITHRHYSEMINDIENTIVHQYIQNYIVIFNEIIEKSFSTYYSPSCEQYSKKIKKELISECNKEKVKMEENIRTILEQTKNNIINEDTSNFNNDIEFGIVQAFKFINNNPHYKDITEERFLTAVKNEIKSKKINNTQTARIVSSIKSYWDNISPNILKNIQLITKNIEPILKDKVFILVNALTINDFVEPVDIAEKRETYILLENDIDNIMKLIE